MVNEQTDQKSKDHDQHSQYLLPVQTPTNSQTTKALHSAKEAQIPRHSGIPVKTGQIAIKNRLNELFLNQQEPRILFKCLLEPVQQPTELHNQTQTDNSDLN